MTRPIVVFAVGEPIPDKLTQAMMVKLYWRNKITPVQRKPADTMANRIAARRAEIDPVVYDVWLIVTGRTVVGRS
jgi:hypothetical protein